MTARTADAARPSERACTLVVGAYGLHVRVRGVRRIESFHTYGPPDVEAWT